MPTHQLAELDRLLTLEFAYVSWDASCQSPLLATGPDFRECRRIEGHDGDHCSGFGASRVRW